MIDHLADVLSVLTLLDWAIVAAYFLISLSIGFIFQKRAGKSMADYFVSGRKLPWWIIGTSMVATTFAVDTPLVITGWVRTEGIWKNWFWWNYAISHVLVVFVFARFWRRAEVLTDNELIELRYHGRPASFLRGFKALYFSTIFNFIVMGWVISAMAKVMNIFFGLDTTFAVVLCLSIAVLYTVFGGLWGVVITDLFQYVVALIGTTVLAVVVINSPEIGGLTGFWSSLDGLSDKLAFMMTPKDGVPTADGFWESSFFIFIIYISVIWWSSHNSDGGGYIVQRLSSAKDERHAAGGMAWFVLNHYIVRLWPWVVVAVCSLIVYPTADQAGGDNEGMYVVMVRNFLGPGLKGLLFVTFLSAFMSTISTQLNWGASYLMNDIYRRFIKKDASPKHYVAISRVATILLSVAAGYIALQIKDISKAWIYLWAMSAGIGLVLILRWFWWRINAWSEISALTASLLTIAGLTIYSEISGVELAMKHQILVVPISIAVWVTVTFLTSPEPDETLHRFYAKIRPWGFWGHIRETSPTEPPRPLINALLSWGFGVISVLLALVGTGKIVLGDLINGGAMVALSALFGIFLYKRFRG